MYSLNSLLTRAMNRSNISFHFISVINDFDFVWKIICWILCFHLRLRLWLQFSLTLPNIQTLITYRNTNTFYFSSLSLAFTFSSIHQFFFTCWFLTYSLSYTQTTKEQRMAIKPSHHYHLSFHLVNSDPESRIVTWNFAQIQQSTSTHISHTWSQNHKRLYLCNVSISCCLMFKTKTICHPSFQHSRFWLTSLWTLKFFTMLHSWDNPNLIPKLQIGTSLLNIYLIFWISTNGN